MLQKSRSQTKLIYCPVEAKVEIKESKYQNIESLDPLDIQMMEDKKMIPIAERLELYWITCLECKNIALNPRQCYACKRVTCDECAKRSDENISLFSDNQAGTSRGGKKILCSCSRTSSRQCKLSRPNVIEKEVLNIADKEISFLCPDRCGTEKIKFHQLGPHSMWFCTKKLGPHTGKKHLLGRNWHLQEEVKASTADLEAQFAALQKRLNRKFAAKASDISVLDTLKEVQTERVDVQAKRIYALEMPMRRALTKVRQLDPFKMPMLADDDDVGAYRAFLWTIPREALEEATDEALERGLVTAIEVGTKANIRSLTSIKLTFDNGIDEIVSPTFGVGDKKHEARVNQKIQVVTACHFGDSTSFVMLNGDPDLAFGAQRTDTMHQVKQVERRVQPLQQVVGIYGYKVKQDVWDERAQKAAGIKKDRGEQLREL